MASVSDALGQIGAAKIFTSSVSNALGDSSDINQSQITELENQLSNTQDQQQRSKIQRQIKRLKRKNKVANIMEKAYKGATDFLLMIAEFVDIGKRQIILWLAKMMVYVIPALEIAVKMILLTNIKKMISCALDPRIPDKWRTEGELININEIDPRMLLESSPYSKYGRYQYFGVYLDEYDLTGVPLHSLARASDMNAFIWYAKNCAHYVSPITIQHVNESTGEVQGDLSEYFQVPSGTSLYDKQVLKGRSAYNYLPGCTFKQTGLSNTIFLCTDKAEEGTDCTYTIVPCTSTWTSVNWYNNRTNYNKSKPLFNLEFANEHNAGAALPRDNFRVKILPKPFQMSYGFISELGNNINVMGDVVNQGFNMVSGITGEAIIQNPAGALKFPGIASMKPHTARFNQQGKYDKKGAYSIDENRFQVNTQGINPKIPNIIFFHLYDKYGDQQVVNTVLIFDKKTKQFYLSKTNPSESEPHGTTLPPALASRVLIECYFGKTVYEFNYDYVMSFRLFDSKCIAASIINGLMNIDIPNPFKKRKNGGDGSLSNTDQLYVDNLVDSMIQKIITEEELEENEFTDCFYTFSNEEYAKMEEETQQKVINGALLTSNPDNPIDAIYKELDAYSTDATLHEQTEILTQVLTKVADIVDNMEDSSNNASANNGYGNSNTGSSSSGGGGGSFIMKAVKFLINEVINAILTPKVLMLIQINQKLMGSDPLSMNIDSYKFSVQDVLNGMKGILSGLIKEVISMIQKELLRIILNQISIILLAYIKKLALEMARKWVDLLRQLLMCFKFNRNKMSGNYGNGNNNFNSAINSALDNIDGADIDALAGELLPNTNPC